MTLNLRLLFAYKVGAYKVTKTGKILAFIGGGIILFGTVLMINDDGGTLTSLAIPFIFIGLLVIMASILAIGNLSKKHFT